MFTLIGNGKSYDPKPVGKGSVLMARSEVFKVGEISRSAVQSIGVPVDAIDPRGREAVAL